MRRYVIPSLVVASLLLWGGCGDSGTEPVETSVSARVNGAAWTAAAVTFTHSDSTLDFTASTVGTSPVQAIRLSLRKIEGTGTFVAGGPSGAEFIWSAGAETYSTIDTVNTVQGQIKLETFDAKQAGGTFSFTAHENGDPNGNIVTVNEGRFSINFEK